jgi:hypothetical protein
MISSLIARRAPALAVAGILALSTLGGLQGCSSDEAAAPQVVDFINVRVEDIGSTSAVVLFDTSAPTTCEVEYGLAEPNLDQRATDPSMTAGSLLSTHRVPLLQLTPATVYYYRARATDGSGATFFSGVSKFTTLEPAPADKNVALLASGTTITSVSSNFGGGANDSAFGANNAIDGELATEWATNGDGDGAFLELDLGQVRTLRRIAFQSRQMTDGTSIMKVIRVVVDASTELGPYDVPDPSQLYSFELATPVSARTVRLQAVQTTGGNSGAKEFQLFE